MPKKIIINEEQIKRWEEILATQIEGSDSWIEARDEI